MSPGKKREPSLERSRISNAGDGREKQTYGGVSNRDSRKPRARSHEMDDQVLEASF
jgi:hypothetical protein